ncbi:MAG: pyrimidine/purine nucleoside phosphorylase [Candidatus Parcubacteria bacterium]|nr:pyrimidine/purine nucleoside phosphorylase [Candidatus Parcubacteria bacterium]
MKPNTKKIPKEKYEYHHEEFHNLQKLQKINEKMEREGWEKDPVNKGGNPSHPHLIEFNNGYSIYYHAHYKRTLKKAMEEKERRKIKHNSYHEGKVQSLGFITCDNKHATVGIVLPGKYDFGIAKAPECIVITYNKIKINGKEYRAISSCDIKVNDPIVFEVEETAAYICYY